MPNYRNRETGTIPSIIQNPNDVIISPQGMLQGQMIRVDDDGMTTYMTREDFNKLYLLEEETQPSEKEVAPEVDQTS